MTNRKAPIQVYQLGYEIPRSLVGLAQTVLHNKSIREALVPYNAIVHNGINQEGFHLGRGNHLPGRVSLLLAHDYRTRNVERDFPFIGKALQNLGYDLGEELTIKSAPGHEVGLDDLETRINFYRSIRTIKPDVTILAA